MLPLGHGIVAFEIIPFIAGVHFPLFLFEPSSRPGPADTHRRLLLYFNPEDCFFPDFPLVSYVGPALFIIVVSAFSDRSGPSRSESCPFHTDFRRSPRSRRYPFHLPLHRRFRPVQTLSFSHIPASSPFSVTCDGFLFLLFFPYSWISFSSVSQEKTHRALDNGLFARFLGSSRPGFIRYGLKFLLSLFVCFLFFSSSSFGCEFFSLLKSDRYCTRANAIPKQMTLLFPPYSVSTGPPKIPSRRILYRFSALFRERQCCSPLFLIV